MLVPILQILSDYMELCQHFVLAVCRNNIFDLHLNLNLN